MSLDQDTHVECAECKEEFDTESQGVYSEKKDAYLCDSCYESELEHASILHRFGADVSQYFVSDYFVNNEYGDPAPSEIRAHRSWSSTDGWRGYYTTGIEGYEAVLDGWTTGGWDDAVARRKSVFNDWFHVAKTYWEEHERFPFGNFFVAFDRTSNVFSTAVTVLIPEGTRDQFINYLGQETFDSLYESLS